jgi:hypothetical protein
MPVAVAAAVVVVVGAAAVAAELTPLSLQMMSPVQSGGFIAGLS